MKKNALYLLVGLSLFTCSSVASASTNDLTVLDKSQASYTTKDFDTQVMIDDGFTHARLKTDGFSNNEFTFNYGALDATVAGKVTYTYLGSDASYTNSFVVNSKDVFTNHGSSATTLSRTFSVSVKKNALLNFGFATLSPAYKVSNQNPASTGSNTYGANEGVFGIVQGGKNGIKVDGKTYQDLLIYNDPVLNGDHDYNDLVVGVNFKPSVSPVPEPETYAMMLAGLGLMGFMVRSKKNA
jgi:hypothetical protein